MKSSHITQRLYICMNFALKMTLSLKTWQKASLYSCTELKELHIKTPCHSFLLFKEIMHKIKKQKVFWCRVFLCSRVLTSYLHHVRRDFSWAFKQFWPILSLMPPFTHDTSRQKSSKNNRNINRKMHEAPLRVISVFAVLIAALLCHLQSSTLLHWVSSLINK